MEDSVKVEEIELADSEDSSSEEAEAIGYQQERRDLSVSRRKKEKEVVVSPVFNVASSQSLCSYLEVFEHYFEAKYHGGQRECALELERFLEGEIKEVYELVGGTEKKYSIIKEKLLAWYKSQQVSGVKHWRRVLSSLIMKPGELYQLFGMRVEEAASHAYPKDPELCAKEMRSTYFKGVPHKFKDRLVQHEEIKVMMNVGKKLTWIEIMRHAIRADKEDKENRVARR